MTTGGGAMGRAGLVAAVVLGATPGMVSAQEPPTLAEVRALRSEIDAQARQLEAQRERLKALEDRLLGSMRASGSAAALDQVTPPGGPGNEAVQVAPGVAGPVGEAPSERQRTVEVAVLSEQGGIITRAGQITLEPSFEYVRADRNRVIFRGIQVPTSVLVGVFDINESRQDILTGSIAGRVGITSRLEINGRLPYVRRRDVSVLAPAAGGMSRSDIPAEGNDIGDVEFGGRYQITNGRGGLPYLIAGIQAVAPTGTSPFTVPRDTGTGVALTSATGGGFWGVTPTLTALLTTDPAVLFGSIGYTRNFARNFNDIQLNSDVFVDRVSPGDAVQGSAGIGISLNPRVTLSLGYAHNWSFGTRTRGFTRTRTTIPGAVNQVIDTPFDTTLRDLQIGRLLFGVSYRTSRTTTINWNVELGATDDAADVRTTLRIPISFDGF